ncbi:uncharacterized protein TOT_030000263 [Theileria orientalis strain Shintoku]|uniref:Replication factor C subunit 1 n=1 Tax=Theileria orientalis strain Shintoku TaxID=869250 RepID=J4CDE5_THEOR|nr:uncharacterized protein TOT_030000263 [Theileria orientalis strain Shintoku]BAM41002.1 uncharacterized protein TOT_030000263 [Theileria orientalis strain Shintoku]|eukprot:XP_009691303.1 uncharacterized protein TOT_030000263 [Theileria orientalis strain Shintoku]
MDIRIFFGKSSEQISEENKKSTKVTKPTKSKAQKKEVKEKTKTKTKTEETSKKTKNERQEKEDVEFGPIYKKKKLLKKMVISESSDSDSSVVVEKHTKKKTLFSEDEEVEVENEVEEVEEITSGESSKKGNKSVSNWVREQLKMDNPEKLEELEKDKCSTENMQMDIKYWCNNEKKLVDPSTKVKKDTRVNVDMNSYLDLLAFPKSQKTLKAVKSRLTTSELEQSNVSARSFKDVYETVTGSSRSEKAKESPSRLGLSMKSPERVLHSKNGSQSPVGKSQVVEVNSQKSVESEKTPSKTRTTKSPKRLMESGESEERANKKRQVSTQKSPVKKLKTVEIKNTEQMESLFGSSDSSPYVSPTKSTGRGSDTSNQSTPNRRKYRKVGGDAEGKKRKTQTKKKQSVNQENVDDSNLVSGRKFVFTGELSMDRDEATYKVKRLGGIVVSAVSGQTDYLVYGDKLEDGRDYTTGTKYKKAKELNKNKGLNIQLINEEQFMNLLKDTPRIEEEDELVEEELTGVQQEEGRLDGKVEGGVGTTKAQDQMLFEKYRPSNLYELMGNQKLIERLKEWLQNYDYTGEYKHLGSSKGKDDSFKAALLSGPPGIGKTTCARLVGESFGYYVMEFNASDQRSKNAVEKITPLVTGTVTLNSFQNNSIRDLKRTLLVLDEIDGMSSGDRGGIQSIIKLIQIARCPIILICNDRYSQKISTLSNKCLDLRFGSPSIELFIKRVNQICKLEKIPATENLLLDLYHKSNGDMRYTLNYLQFYATTKSKDGPDGTINKKDESYSQNIFDNCNKVFNLSKMSLRDKLSKVNEIFFTDYNIMSLMLQENYVKYNRNIGVISKIALDYVCGDMVNKVMQRTQTYSLLPDLSSLTAVIPALEMNKAGSGLTERLSFPQWLGKQSTTTKNRRILSEISMNLSYKTTLYGSNLLMDGYLELIYQNVMKHLVKENVDECVDYINEVGITREMVVDGIANLRFKNQENIYAKISTKTKTQLTKKMATQLVKVVNTKRNRYTTYDSKPDHESEEEEQDDDYDPLLKKMNPNKKQAKQKRK